MMRPTVDLNSRMNKNILVLLVVNAIIIIILSYIYPPFLTFRVFRSLLSRLSEINIVAISTTVVFISGGFDLSFPSVMALSGIVCGRFYAAGFGLAPSVMLALGTGALIGLGNASLISRLKLNPFIITVAMDLIIRSLAYGVSGARTITGFPDHFLDLEMINILRLPFLFVLMVMVALAVHILLRYTVFGRYIHALGANERAAKICGLNVNRTKQYVYVFSGFMAALAGLMVTIRVGSAPPNTGINVGLEVITAVVVGGTLITGGEGSILGTSLGVLAMFLLLTGFNILGLNPYWKIILLGIIMLNVIGSGKIYSALTRLLQARKKDVSRERP